MKRGKLKGMSDGVPCLIMRGGTSKAAYFLRDDLPTDAATRNDLILRLVGSPDRRQIDGIGGAHPLTTKVAVVGPSPVDSPNDVDFLFLQPSVEEPLVSDSQNCGNIVAGVGPFAVERELVKPDPGAETATVRIHVLNTGASVNATFPLTPNGMPQYQGEVAIAGVPGTAAPVLLHFSAISGGSCGALLPTGKAVNHLSGVACTLIDNGMPVVVMQAADLGISGYESCATLEANVDLRRRLEEIRLQAGPLMNLHDVAALPVPKLTLVAPPMKADADICTRTFIPHRCHNAIGVFGALSTAAAAMLEGTPAHEMLRETPGRLTSGLPEGRTVTLEHPTGTFTIELSLGHHSDGVTVEAAGIVRTARKLADAVVFARPATT